MCTPLSWSASCTKMKPLHYGPPLILVSYPDAMLKLSAGSSVSLLDRWWSSRGVRTVQDLSLLSPEDEAKIIGWNQEAAEKCLKQTVSETFDRVVRENPTAEAIFSAPDADNGGSSRSWTYTELDAASDRLARYICSTTDIGPGSMVPLCFEHTAWYVVAVLAVLKTGAAFVPLDPKHPKERRQEIIDQLSTDITLGSCLGAAASEGMTRVVLTVSTQLDAQLGRNSTPFIAKRKARAV